MAFREKVSHAKRQPLVSADERVQAERDATQSQQDAERRKRERVWLELVTVWKPVAAALVARKHEPDEVFLRGEGFDELKTLATQHHTRDHRGRWYDDTGQGNPRTYRAPSAREEAQRTRVRDGILERHLFGAWNMYVRTNSSGVGMVDLYMGVDERIYNRMVLSDVGDQRTGRGYHLGVNPISYDIDLQRGTVPGLVLMDEIESGLANLVANHNLPV